MSSSPSEVIFFKVALSRCFRKELILLSYVNNSIHIILHKVLSSERMPVLRFWDNPCRLEVLNSLNIIRFFQLQRLSFIHFACLSNGSSQNIPDEPTIGSRWATVPSLSRVHVHPVSTLILIQDVRTNVIRPPTVVKVPVMISFYVTAFNCYWPLFVHKLVSHWSILLVNGVLWCPDDATVSKRSRSG